MPSKMNTVTYTYYLATHSFFWTMALFLLSSVNFVYLDGIPIKQVTRVQTLCIVLTSNGAYNFSHRGSQAIEIVVNISNYISQFRPQIFGTQM